MAGFLLLVGVLVLGLVLRAPGRVIVPALVLIWIGISYNFV